VTYVVSLGQGKEDLARRLAKDSMKEYQRTNSSARSQRPWIYRDLPPWQRGGRRAQPAHQNRRVDARSAQTVPPRGQQQQPQQQQQQQQQQNLQAQEHTQWLQSPQEQQRERAPAIPTPAPPMFALPSLQHMAPACQPMPWQMGSPWAHPQSHPWPHMPLPYFLPQPQFPPFPYFLPPAPAVGGN
jgi:hypothetical protein